MCRYRFTCSCPVFPEPLAKETVFFPFYILASFVKDQQTIDIWVYFLTLYSVPLIRMSVFVPVPHCLDYCRLVILSAVQDSYTSCFCFCFFFSLSSRFALAVLGLLWFHINFLRYLFWFCENCHRRFDRDHFKSVGCFGYYGHFNNIISYQVK